MDERIHKTQTMLNKGERSERESRQFFVMDCCIFVLFQSKTVAIRVVSLCHNSHAYISVGFVCPYRLVHVSASEYLFAFIDALAIPSPFAIISFNQEKRTQNIPKEEETKSLVRILRCVF